MLREHERNCGLGMDALVTVCSWNTNGIMVWAWMFWSSYALGTRSSLWFGHDALVIVCSGGGSTWWQRASPAHRPWSLTSFKEILLEPPNAGSTRLHPTKNKYLLEITVALWPCLGTSTISKLRSPNSQSQNHAAVICPSCPSTCVHKFNIFKDKLCAIQPMKIVTYKNIQHRYHANSSSHTRASVAFIFPQDANGFFQCV